MKVKRDPTLHIKLSDLAKVLKTLGYSDAEKEAMQILQLSANFQLSERYLLEVPTSKMKRQAKDAQAGAVSRSTKSLFNSLLTQERMNRNHRKFRKPSLTDSTLEKAAKAALDFITEYELKPNPGFKEFIRIGMDLMGRSYRLQSFSYLYDRICQHYSFVIALRDDDKKQETREVYRVWRKKVMDMTGQDPQDMAKEVDQYVNFLYARQEIEKQKAKIPEWVDAQFIGLEFVSVVPKPSQLHGSKAIKRYVTYAMDRKRTNVPSKEEDSEYFRLLRGEA